MRRSEFPNGYPTPMPPSGCGCAGSQSRMIPPPPPGPGPGPGPSPGPGPFPPPPGPGPFPPPPGPGPFPPFPLPIPLPIPWPFPGPGQQRSVTVVINGGRAFPQITQPYYIRYRPGMTVYQALVETGVVQIGFNGQIVAVNGIYITNDIRYTLRLNGRPLPSNQLYIPLQPGDAVGLELFYAVRSEQQ